MNVEMRASDEDRLRVIAMLQRHTTAGRLTLDEFSERVSSVYSARTIPELVEVTRDLPADAPEAPPAPPSGARQLVIAFAVAIVVLVLLGVFLSFR